MGNKKKHRYGINPLHTEETKAKAKKGIQRTIVARTASFEKRFADFEKENDCTRVSKLYKKYGQGWKKIKDDLDVITVGQYSFLKNFEIEKIIEYNLESRDALARSNIEDEVLSFIYDIFSGEIQPNTRSIISPQELDIYIPEKKVAIEVDGIYWHSTNVGKDKNYHLNKTIECEKREIRLIHITEWEWLNKQDICKSILASSLGVHKRKIDAIKCEIEEVGIDQAAEFLEENNINKEVLKTM